MAARAPKHLLIAMESPTDTKSFLESITEATTTPSSPAPLPPKITSISKDEPAPESLSTVDVVVGEPSIIAQLLQSQSPSGSFAPLWVQSSWAGVEPLLNPALPRNYELTNVRDVFGKQMVEYVIGYLIAIERRLFERHSAQLKNQWDDIVSGGTIYGKTIGIIGVGSIGAEVARGCKAFDMKVKGFTRSSGTCPHVDEYSHDNLVEFVKDLDYCLALLPNTPATNGMISKEVVDSLPKHAVFLNAGRGASVNLEAIVSSLNEDRLAAAVIDVFQEEPVTPESSLWKVPNLHITSHTAAYSNSSDIANLFVSNYERYCAGETLLHPIDFERGY
eukprot:TRINITY_DN10966_c0_g1_i1.p1 TRINITY_DN10966_c0_g1~~TRINITY_DN10966_c0_g1_i1.p1  ORF type:complete len:374 (-),score=81.02 TRINITY_DN10966_c0_g1_i1:251-1249(-)